MARERVDVDVNLSDGPTKRALMTRIGTLQGLYSLDLKPIRPTRSGQQNRYLWGVCYRAFTEFMREQGEAVTSEEAHEFFKQRFGLRRQMHNPVTGEVVEIVRSTTTYDVPEMSTYIELVIAFLDELGVVVPEPEGMAVR